MQALKRLSYGRSAEIERRPWRKISRKPASFNINGQAASSAGLTGFLIANFRQKN
jgi:hypothetical protein